MAKKILIVEDDPGILLSLKDEFEAEGYTVRTSGNGEEALVVAGDENPDLIILDVMLPGLDGYEVCKRLRARADFTPIIMLTVKDKEIDKVLGLELGADDYLTKPFSLRELAARVKAVLRRTEERSHDVTHYRFGHIDLDFKKYEAKKKGIRIDLTPLEFQMLKLFIERKEHVLSRDEILDRVWGKENLIVSHRTVDSHISNIRKKIEEDPSCPRHILGIRGVGYKFVD
jgi:two-component system alkaline phosphatase synthesis response regulator PhoP